VAFFIPSPVHTRRDLLGGRLVWLLEIHLGTRKAILLAREPIAVPSIDSGTLSFDGGLSEVTFSDEMDLFGISETSRSVSIACVPPLNIAELVGRGFDLTTTTASLSQIIEGEDFSDRRPVFKSVRIRDPQYGSEHEEFRFSLKSNPFDDRATIPPLTHVVNDRTWPDRAGAAAGRAYPQVFGQPGIKDTTTYDTWGGPALYVDTTGATRRFLIAGHECTLPATVKITNKNAVSDSAGPYSVYTSTDGLGRTVSLIDVPSTVSPMVLDGGDDFVCMWKSGGGLPALTEAAREPFARGTITVTAIGASAGDTITVGPFSLTAVAGARSSGSNDFSVGIPGSVDAQALEIKEALADPLNDWRLVSPAIIQEAAVSNAVVDIRAEESGTDGNKLTLAASITAPGALALSGPKLTGGRFGQDYSMHGAGDILRHFVQYSGQIPIDSGRMESAIAQLNDIRLDFVIEEPVRVWDWLKSNLLDLLPASLGISGDGIYPIVWDRELSSADAVAAIDVDRDQWERTAPVSMEFLDGEPVNRFKLSHSKNMATGTIQEYSILDANRDANDPGTDENIYAKLSRSRYSSREKAETALILYRAASAFQILGYWSRIYGFPIYSVEYVAPIEWGWLRAGAVLSLTDADLHIENQIAIVQAIEWADDDLIGFRLSWLEDLPRDSRKPAT